ncbi:MAG: 2OG-Fe(II) oxygenase [Rhodospirillales bacterium]|nr:2OG-Fe(II) oxygenase [Rhodospirillales bacterium]
MISLDASANWLPDLIARAMPQTFPYRHWLLEDALPIPMAKGLANLPVPVADIGDTKGRRETNNSTRVFLSPDFQAKHPVAAAFAAAFQDRANVAALAKLTGAPLAGGYLRIEYCRDTDGFWLEPHTDIGAKLYTMLFYLSDVPQAEDWGTDIYETPDRHLGAASGGFNRGLIFVPGTDTWHGFRRKKIDGVRKSIIVNYVKDEWRTRGELAFPESPVADA